ncbi:hypothetical protein [Yersinia hibernica]|uniref:Uncharacterized protein n=1 Tax=Yersinia enterocolitica LC20 TaxID=1443113 RepID=A0A7U4GIJ2_YEREN|nr:hypothetical protein [Yersinia hibernica]AHM76169.1 hypothetical protein LC20_04917 [Yersinia hibernica]
MLEILKMQPLIKDIHLSDTNVMCFTLSQIPAQAIDYGHSLCISVVFTDKKMISHSLIHYISLMLVALEDMQDFALQLRGDYWWLWHQYTLDERKNTDNEWQELSIIFERIYAVIQIFNSLVATMNTSKTRLLNQHKIDVSRIVP